MRKFDRAPRLPREEWCGRYIEVGAQAQGRLTGEHQGFRSEPHEFAVSEACRKYTFSNKLPKVLIPICLKFPELGTRALSALPRCEVEGGGSAW